MIGEEQKPETPDNGMENGTDKTAEPTGEAAVSPEQAAADREAALTKELLYQRAEFDNYKKRILREQDNAIKFANERIVRDLLPVVDLFDRATLTSETLKTKLEGNAMKGEVAAFILGVEMVQKELIQTLGRIGVEFVGAKNEAFDPQRHEAISEVETDKADEVGHVVQVAQRGCLYAGRLLKPAQVVVGRAKS